MNAFFSPRNIIIGIVVTFLAVAIPVTVRLAQVQTQIKSQAGFSPATGLDATIDSIGSVRDGTDRVQKDSNGRWEGMNIGVIANLEDWFVYVYNPGACSIGTSGTCPINTGWSPVNSGTDDGTYTYYAPEGLTAGKHTFALFDGNRGTIVDIKDITFVAPTATPTPTPSPTRTPTPSPIQKMSVAGTITFSGGNPSLLTTADNLVKITSNGVERFVAPTVASSTSWYFSLANFVVIGDTYKVEAPPITGYTRTADRTGQVAGGTPNCSGACNFTYTATAVPPTPTVTPTASPTPSPTPPPLEAAACEGITFKQNSQTVSTLIVGQTYDVEIKMSNRDATIENAAYQGPAWTSGYFLGFPIAGDTGTGEFMVNVNTPGSGLSINDLWQINWQDPTKLRIPVSGSVPPCISGNVTASCSQTFRTRVTPQRSSTTDTPHTFYWGMVHEGVRWFGGQCASNVSVTAVTEATRCVVLSTNSDPGTSTANITTCDGLSAGQRSGSGLNGVFRYPLNLPTFALSSTEVSKTVYARFIKNGTGTTGRISALAQRTITYSPAVTPTPTVIPTPTGVEACNTKANSGGQGVDTREWEMNQAQGWFNFEYDAVGLPDKFEIFYANNIIFTTGGPVSGAKNNIPVIFGPGSLTKVKVVVTGNDQSTFWEYKLTCPQPGNPPPTPTSTIAPTPTVTPSPTSTPGTTTCFMVTSNQLTGQTLRGLFQSCVPLTASSSDRTVVYGTLAGGPATPNLALLLPSGDKNIYVRFLKLIDNETLGACSVRTRDINLCMIDYDTSIKLQIAGPSPTITSTPPPTTTPPACPKLTFPDVELIGTPGNGVIDLRDFNRWRAEFIDEHNHVLNRTKTADFNCSTTVENLDYNIWSRVFGRGGI